jgi:tetratricopeptide (TPR) repeat protein
MLYEQVAKEKDGFVPASLKLAAIAAATRTNAEAYELLDAVLKKAPNNVDALNGKAQLKLSEGKLDEALSNVNAALAADRNAAAAHFLQGRILASRDQPAEAIAAYKEALRLNSKLAAANVELARLHLAINKPNEAVQFAQAAIRVAPAYPEAQLMLARAQLATGNPASAEKTLAALNTSYPESAVVQTEMGRLYLLKGDKVRGRAALERALAKDATQIAALEGLTGLDIRDKKPGEARARVDAALAASPRNDALYLLAGRTYAELQDAPAAERAFKQALDINPANLQTYIALGQLYAQQRRLPEATTEFETLVQRQPKAIGPQTALGILLQLQNRPDEARARYEKVLQLDSRAAVAANNLAWIYAQQGTNLDIALQLAQTAKSQLPDMPEVNDTLGWVYHKKGMANLAIPPLQQSIAKAPNNPTYHYHLGVAYASAGDKARARQSLERALALNPSAEESAEAKKALEGLKG